MERMLNWGDEHWMARAIELARLGGCKVSPNPMVGAVLVKDGKKISEGYHGFYGGPHAEVMALRNCSEEAKGATLYVTLEPCSHYGKTPPCTEAILAAGIKRVVVGSLDTNPIVNGKGVEKLLKAGVDVEIGVLEEECLELNKVFFHRMNHDRPYCILKSAMSLDGKIATSKGESKWITGEKARKRGHQTRSEVAAIMVGIGTVLADDPLLTCRMGSENNLVRVVIDPTLEMPLESQLVKTASDHPLWIVCKKDTDSRKSETFRILKEVRGISLIEQETDSQGHFDMRAVAKELATRGVESLLIEGGGRLNDCVLRAGIVDEVHFYMAPIIIGGRKALSPVSGQGFGRLMDAVKLVNIQLEMLGDDWLIKGKVDRGNELNWNE